MSKSGILAGGNFIVDHVKLIDSWPTQDSLVTIQSEESSNGGGPFNVLVNLGRLFPELENRPFPLAAAGLVGDDANGDWIVGECESHSIDVAQLHRSPGAPTSYTDVMTVANDGRRTFFHQRGANAQFGSHSIDFSSTSARIFYLGYLLLLDRLDHRQPDGSTEAAELLRFAGQHGLLRVVDLVSEDSDRFHEVISPSLPETDVLLTNEFEASRLSGIELCGNYTRSTARDAAEKLLSMGVREWVVIHAPQGAVALSSAGEFHAQGSLCIPEDQIAGAVGAGDAFATGILYGLHEGLEIAASLRLASQVAACCLKHATTSGGIPPMAECAALAERYEYRDF